MFKIQKKEGENINNLSNSDVLNKISNLRKAVSLDELLEQSPNNQTIIDAIVKCWTKINDNKYKNIVCSISGGSDSDVMLDMVWRCDINNKVAYVWFNTGLEYQATKDHLYYLEQKYGITIQNYRPKKPIPIACNEHGQPFVSKNVSEMISRLQKHGFEWEDKSYEELVSKYCKWDSNKEKYVGCVSALAWWCNVNQSARLNINYNKWLKEFMILNPPEIKISSKCCTYSKKNVLHDVIKITQCDLNISGIRKWEGGIRGIAYKNCFDEHDESYDNYRPLFWYANDDKRDYENSFDVVHSNCYVKYGLQRTGCAGCSFGRNFEFELDVIQEHEPKLYTAVNNIFGKSYEYTRKYREFANMMNWKEKALKTE